jgi:hypothetical protein
VAGGLIVKGVPGNISRTVNLKLKYMPDWSEEQKRCADEKCRILSSAAKEVI